MRVMGPGSGEAVSASSALPDQRGPHREDWTTRSFAGLAAARSNAPGVAEPVAPGRTGRRSRAGQRGGGGVPGSGGVSWRTPSSRMKASISSTVRGMKSVKFSTPFSVIATTSSIRT